VKTKTTFDQFPPDKDHGSTVLIIDDDPRALRDLESICREIGPSERFRILTSETIEQGLQTLSEAYVDVILLDKHIGIEGTSKYKNGIEAVPEFLRQQFHAQILIVTGSSNVADVARAMALGAFSYVVKGTPRDLLIAQIKRAANVAHLTREHTRHQRLQTQTIPNVLVGQSSAVRHLRSQLEMAAESNRPVLFWGDVGTGKSSAARLVHNYRQSYLKQNNRPFIAVNMASMTVAEADRQLFGEESAGINGVETPGYFELANHGTLFIDEISEVPLELQSKILRVLEHGKFSRLGSVLELQSRFKLVCSTNRNLDEMVAEGRFNRELYLRISTFPVRVPSLDDRRDDIGDIVRSILPKCCEDNQVFVDFSELPQEFLEFLRENPIAGNIRGIDQCLSRLLMLSPRSKRGRPVFSNWRNVVAPFLHKADVHSSSNQMTLSELLNAPYDVVSHGFPGLESVITKIEENIIKDALAKYPTQMAAAEALGFTRGGFSIRLKRLGIRDAKSYSKATASTAEQFSPREIQ